MLGKQLPPYSLEFELNIFEVIEHHMRKRKHKNSAQDLKIIL